MTGTTDDMSTKNKKKQHITSFNCKKNGHYLNDFEIIKQKIQ